MATSKNMLDIEKYKAAFLYLLNHLGNIEGRKKAYKMMFFLDFDFFEAYDMPFMGETYKALPMGPAPSYFDSLADILRTEGMIEVKGVRKSTTHENDTIVYTPKKELEYSFTPEEQRMLDRIVRIYGNQTGKQLEDLSHSQAPYAAVGIGDVIPYELSYYRDTPGLKA